MSRSQQPAYQAELKIALAAVIAASEVCRVVQRKLSSDALEKKDRSPVTIADYASQALICRQIHSYFPSDPIVGEEDATDLRSGDQKPFVEKILAEIHAVGIEATADQLLEWIDSGNHDGTASRFWTLDPIDGTKGFLRKEQFAVSLALIENHQIQVAALSCPNFVVGERTGVVMYAIRGQGAYMIPLDEPDAEPQKLAVSTISDSSQARLCESVESGHSAHDESASVQKELKIAVDPVRMDSQAKYAAVASGMAEIYLRLPTRPGYEEKIWDHAGGVLVLEEAGGVVTDVDGKPLDFSRGTTLKGNRGVVVTNGLLHDKVLVALKKTMG